VGRPKSFANEDVLDAALQCFQKRGYEGTSIDDLVQCTGLSRASLYNSFGDKQHLFVSVLDYYESRQLERLRAQIAAAPSAREALLDLMISVASPDEKLGCLVVNAGMELSPADPAMQARVAQSLDGIRLMLRDLLRQAKVKDPEGAAGVLQTVFLGLRVLVRTGAPPRQILAVAEKALGNFLP
jgi:TetR/AcrR family transcriptional regulator, transcriptional repressor for nem operon